MSFSSFELFDHGKPILVFGRDGQVGRALQSHLKCLNVPVVFLGRSDCDLSDQLSIREVLNRYQPQVIINAAAYTAVDKAESADERALAFAINAMAPKTMAQYAAGLTNGILVHYSSDYVFSDTKSTAYLETDPAGPLDQLCVYGQSKLAGERAIEEVFNATLDSDNIIDTHKQSNVLKNPKYFILRTSWVYGDGGNFIRTMLCLASKQAQLKVVADQFGVPTSAQWLAEVGIQIAGSRIESGIYHAVPDGEVSWHGLAVFAIETAASYGEYIEVESENIVAIPATDYPVPATRPYNSRLSNQKLKKALSEISFTTDHPDWTHQVKEYVKNHVKKSPSS